MPSNNGQSSVVGQIVVAVVVALLVGGSAPWWWKEVFPTSSQPTPIQQETVPQASLPSSDDNAEEQTETECIVTIANTLVALMQEPSKLSQELVAISPGEYMMLDYQVVNFAGQDQGWFQIEADGRTGWIANDTWTIDSKTNACP